jgi:hypothetical protein
MRAKILQRVWTEVKNVNDDFFNLRTVITSDDEDNDAARFYFMMLPNDGAMAHLTILGTFSIPEVRSWCYEGAHPVSINSHSL